MKLIVIFKVLFGVVVLILAAIGLFVPILPTTPFVLLAIGAFSQVPTIQKKVLSIPFVSEYYQSYTKKNGLNKKTVITSLAFLWGMLLLSVVLMQKLWIVFVLLPIGIAVTVHILYLARGKRN